MSFGENEGDVDPVKRDHPEISWSSRTKEPLGAAPAVTNGIVFVGWNDGRVHALDAARSPAPKP